MYVNAQKAGRGADTLVPMKPNFTDQYRYLRGYVRAESTDIAKTWAAARLAPATDNQRPDSNVRSLVIQPGGNPRRWK
jgi:hypothetical protein